MNKEQRRLIDRLKAHNITARAHNSILSVDEGSKSVLWTIEEAEEMIETYDILASVSLDI